MGCGQVLVAGSRRADGCVVRGRS